MCLTFVSSQVLEQLAFNTIPLPFNYPRLNLTSGEWTFVHLQIITHPDGCPIMFRPFHHDPNPYIPAPRSGQIKTPNYSPSISFNRDSTNLILPSLHHHIRNKLRWSLVPNNKLHLALNRERDPGTSQRHLHDPVWRLYQSRQRSEFEYWINSRLSPLRQNSCKVPALISVPASVINFARKQTTS